MVTLKGEAKQRYVADLFSGIAGRYDLMNDLMTGGQHRRWKNETARLATKDLPSSLPRLILDVATGTGDLALTTGKRPGVDRVVGVDLLPEMIRLARCQINCQGISPGELSLPWGMRLPCPSPMELLPAALRGSAFATCPGPVEQMEFKAHCLKWPGWCCPAAG